MKAIVLKNVDQKELRKLVSAHHGKRDSTGKTALMYAAECSNEQAAQFLIHYEQRVQDQHGKTAFMYAAKSNSIKIMKLLQQERNILAQNGETALMAAATFNAVDAVQELLHDQVCKRSVQGNTALMMASQMGNIQCCKLLLKEAKMQNNEGMTALMFGAFYNHEDVVKLLVQYEIRMKNKENFTALQCAAQSNSIAVIKYLIPEYDINETKDKSTALMFAAEKNSIEIVKQLIDKQAKMQRIDGLTALLIAISRNNVEIVNLLKDIEEDITSQQGLTPLMAASISKNVELSKQFIKFAGKQTNQGVTALMFAAEVNALEIVKFLLPYEKEIKTKGNETAFHFAIKFNSQDVIEYLYETEENTELLPGFTNLMFSAMNGCKFYVEKYGSKELRKTEESQKQTALMSAAAYGHVELFDYLKDEIKMQDINGNTSLLIFVQNCQELDKEKIKLGLEKLKDEKEIVNNQGVNWRQAALLCDQINVIELMTDEEISKESGKQQNLLFQACFCSAPKCFNYLLQKLYKTTTQDQTDILMTCAAYNRADLINIILKDRQAKDLIKNKNQFGFTALMFAAQSGAIESAKLLTKQLKKQNLKGISALMIAASVGNKEMIKLLTKELKLVSQEIEFQNQNMKMTALIFAITYKRFDILDLLEDENQIEVDGKTAALIYLQNVFSNKQNEKIDEKVLKQLCKNLNQQQLKKVQELQDKFQ